MAFGLDLLEVAQHALSSVAIVGARRQELFERRVGECLAVVDASSKARGELRKAAWRRRVAVKRVVQDTNGAVGRYRHRRQGGVGSTRYGGGGTDRQNPC